MAFLSPNVIIEKEIQKYIWGCSFIFFLCVASGCSVSVTAGVMAHLLSAAATAFKNNFTCSQSLLGSTDAYINLLFSLRVPGAAALVRREESSTAPKKENSSSSSASSPREEEIMMEPIPRVEEDASEVISESIILN